MDSSGTGDEALSLERYASVCAALAEGDHSLDEVLAANGLDTPTWQRASNEWTHRLAAAAMGDSDDALPDAYAEAFARAQDGLKPVPELTVDAWAALAVEASGPEGLSRALAVRGLTDADYLRLSRAWTKRLAGNRMEAKRYAEAFSRKTRDRTAR